MHHMGCEAGYRFSQCISAKELWSLPQFCSLLTHLIPHLDKARKRPVLPHSGMREGQSLNHLGLCKGT